MPDIAQLSTAKGRSGPRRFFLPRPAPVFTFAGKRCKIRRDVRRQRRRKPSKDRVFSTAIPQNPPKMLPGMGATPVGRQEGYNEAAMRIHCPECDFERELESSQIPENAVMATCPRCGARFRFREGGRDVGERPTGDDPLPPGAITPGRAGSGAESAGSDPAGTTRAEEPLFMPGPKQSGKREQERSNGRSLFSGSGDSSLAWETAPFAAMPRALYTTVLQVMFAAPDFFTRVGQSCASLLRPCLFYILISMFQSVVYYFQILAKLNELAAGANTPQILDSAERMMQGMSLPMLCIVGPPVYVVQLLFLAGVFSLMIRLISAERHDLGITIRVVAYSAAPGILWLIPIMGPMAGMIWVAVSCFIGCKFAHRLSWRQAAAALLPLYILGIVLSLQFNRMLLGLAMPQ
jgi:hypothetical protein